MRKSKNSHGQSIPVIIPGADHDRNKGPQSVQGPQMLRREATTRGQKNWSEDTIIWGDDDAFPLRLALAVQRSPAASSCIRTISKFIRGAEFSDKELMKIKVNKSGQTLWDLHSTICDTLALFEGFSINFKFNDEKNISNSFHMPIENLRFVIPEQETEANISNIKYNPYFGTEYYKKEYTKEYALWDAEALDEQLSKRGTKFTGQVYYYGKTRPLFRFYPMPSYWSAEKWIYVDGKIQEAHAENLDNGFFQSVIIEMIGDPNQPSRHPDHMKEVTGEDGVKRKVSTKTVGQAFNEFMAENFSGSKKMGTGLVLWADKADKAMKVNPMQTSANHEMFLALQDICTKNITVAFNVPSILANISEGVNLGSGGSEIQKAVELMQSNTSDDRNRLEQFYNEILLPSLDIEGNKIKKNAKVEIVNYNPITVPVEIDDKFWQVLNDKEKRMFIEKNLPSIELIEEDPQVGADGKELPIEGVEINDNLKNMTGRQQQQFLRIIRQFGKGTLTFEQASIQLKGGFGFTDEEILKILETDETTDPNIVPERSMLSVAKH